jgi:biotin transport system permease protein
MLTLTSPVKTWLHAVPAGIKLLVLLSATVLLVSVYDPALFAVLIAGILLLCLSFGPAFLAVAAGTLRPLWPFVLVVGLWHVWQQDVGAGLTIVLHMIAIVLLANFVTMTTKLSEMMAVIERQTPTISRWGISPRALSPAVALTIRLVPVLNDRLASTSLAYRARSWRRPRWRLVVLATLAVLDEADHVADALRAHGGINPPNQPNGG